MYTRLPKTSVSIVLLANIYLAFNPNPKQRRENVQGLILFLKVNVKRPSCQGHLRTFKWGVYMENPHVDKCNRPVFTGSFSTVLIYNKCYDVLSSS